MKDALLDPFMILSNDADPRIASDISTNQTRISDLDTEFECDNRNHRTQNLQCP